MSQYFQIIYRMLEENEDCSELINKIIPTILSKKEHKSYISLKLRNLLKLPNISYQQIDDIIHNNILMKRDYWSCIEYYINHDSVEIAINYMVQYIKTLDTYDIDYMIANKWDMLIKKWDGYPVETSNNMNVINTSKLKKYYYDMTHMIDIYKNKIKSCDLAKFKAAIIDCNVLIDGANISHIEKDFNYNELLIVIKMLIELGYKPKVVIHERHIIDNSELLQ